MRSTDPPLTTVDRTTLLDVAWRALETGVASGRRTSVRALDFAASLRVPRATFVTLWSNGDLRGCMGSLVAHRPLVEDVAAHAFAAAFDDPRFRSLGRADLGGLDVHLSVLSIPEPMAFASEAELLAQLRPQLDGLVFELGHHVGTLLPSAWTSLPDPAGFLGALKRKAGLPVDFWSDDIRVSRYTVEAIP